MTPALYLTLAKWERVGGLWRDPLIPRCVTLAVALRVQRIREQAAAAIVAKGV